jgi:transcriptional regulator with XRE-family HTH domain
LIDRIRVAINESGFSLNQLSALCGIDRGRLSRFMRGERRTPLPEKLEKIGAWMKGWGSIS